MWYVHVRTFRENLDKAHASPISCDFQNLRMTRGRVLHVGMCSLTSSWSGTVVAVGDGSSSGSSSLSWIRLWTSPSPSASSSTLSSWLWSIIQWQRSLRSCWVLGIWSVIKSHTMWSWLNAFSSHECYTVLNTVKILTCLDVWPLTSEPSGLHRYLYSWNGP